MARNSIHEAIVLKSGRFAEYHKRLSLLTNTSGVLDVVAYGAFKSKSKLSGLTESFVHLKVYLYFEPVRKQYKLSDAEAITTFDGIRGDLKRFYIAALLSELVLITYAGGDEHARLFPLLRSGFERLSAADDAGADAVLVQMLTRFLDVIGYPPHWEQCARCGVVPRGARYVAFGGEVLCDRCGTPESVRMTEDGIAFLRYSIGTPLDAALRVSIDPTTRQAAKLALIRMAQGVAERPLRSLAGSETIL